MIDCLFMDFSSVVSARIWVLEWVIFRMQLIFCPLLHLDEIMVCGNAVLWCGFLFCQVSRSVGEVNSFETR